MNKNLGLKARDIDTIILILSGFPQINEAIIFGSRAKGNFKTGSDVDIVLKGSTLDYNICSAIRFKLNEESDMPYRFDILNFNTIANKALIEHIERVGVCIYRNEGIAEKR